MSRGGWSGLATEVCSSLRVGQFVARYGLRPGHAIDIKTCDDRGHLWDRNDVRKRNCIISLIHEIKPSVVIGYPMCTMFSLLQNLSKINKPRRSSTASISWLFYI